MWDAGSVCRRTRLASGSSSFTSAMPRSTVRAVPPVSWMVMACSLGPSGQPLGLGDPGDLVGLAAEPHQDHGREVGMARVAADRPPQHVHPFALARHAAARLVGEGDDPVDVRVVGERTVVGERAAA